MFGKSDFNIFFSKSSHKFRTKKGKMKVDCTLFRFRFGVLLPVLLEIAVYFPVSSVQQWKAQQKERQKEQIEISRKCMNERRTSAL